MAPPPPPPPHESDSCRYELILVQYLSGSTGSNAAACTCRSEAAAPAVVTTVDVTAARDLIISSAGGGHRYLYLDVRAEEELAKLGHLVEPQNCLNVPYMFITPQGKQASNSCCYSDPSILLNCKTKSMHVYIYVQHSSRSQVLYGCNLHHYPQQLLCL